VTTDVVRQSAVLLGMALGAAGIRCPVALDAIARRCAFVDEVLRGLPAGQRERIERENRAAQRMALQATIATSVAEDASDFVDLAILNRLLSSEDVPGRAALQRLELVVTSALPAELARLLVTEAILIVGTGKLPLGEA